MSSSQLGSQSGEHITRQTVQALSKSSRDRDPNPRKTQGQPITLGETRQAQNDIPGRARTTGHTFPDQIFTRRKAVAPQPPSLDTGSNNSRDLPPVEKTRLPKATPLKSSSGDTHGRMKPKNESSRSPSAESPLSRPQGKQNSKAMLRSSEHIVTNGSPNPPQKGQIRPGLKTPSRSPAASKSPAPLRAHGHMTTASVSDRSQTSVNSGNSAASTDSVEAFVKRNGLEAAGDSMPRMPHDWVLCVDGTRNDMLKEPELDKTNVARITELVKSGRQGNRMVAVAYQQGIGSSGECKTKDGTAKGWFQDLQKDFQAMAPSDDLITRLVSINYAYISMMVCPQRDRIFLFGFSRGAYIAQITAALVADLGVFNNQRFSDGPGNGKYHEIIHKIVQIWIKHQGKMKPDTWADLKPYAHGLVLVDIEFLGLFDKVASVGMPDVGMANLQSTRFRFAEDVSKRQRIRNAYHAAAISEHRNNFKPVLWKQGSANEHRQKVSQVWFPGYHTSIGGGSGKQGMMVDLIALVWMVSKCTGLAGVINEVNLVEMIKLDGQHAGKWHGKDIADSTKGMYAGLGDHYRQELGSSSIDKLHHLCKETEWRSHCAPNMPNILGEREHPITRTQMMLDQGRFDTPNVFEERMLKLFKAVVKGPVASVPPPSKQASKPAIRAGTGISTIRRD
ncbi:hypothetical protein KVR01_002009 [Diaporthe batatas]|uniref:uncharacterized protein n=1 Tax=Diaporthe batatas TaxID=748121 RepID=UPI001D044A75|nr:uncharacterized protein KVR01_002009 [Diaporthe batatas]KAG8166320.1 hypothetical protein KVR01_002009 [Diaporthe batatas]